MWNSKRQSWPTYYKEEIHQLQPVRRETYTTPGMKGRDLAARRFGKVETDTIKSLITFHWTTFMSASPGKSSNQDPQSASRAIARIDRSASSLKWSQGTYSLKEARKEWGRALNRDKSTTVTADGRELKTQSNCCFGHQSFGKFGFFMLPWPGEVRVEELSPEASASILPLSAMLMRWEERDNLSCFRKVSWRVTESMRGKLIAWY